MTKAISLSFVLLFSQTVLSSSSLSSSSVRYKACFAQKNSSQWQEQVLYQCCTTCESICWGVGAPGGGFSTSCQIPNPDFGHNEEQAYPVSGSCEPEASASLDELMTQLKHRQVEQIHEAVLERLPQMILQSCSIIRLSRMSAGIGDCNMGKTW